MFKSSITKCLPKKALQEIIWDLGDIIQYIFVFCLQNVFICYYCLFFFLFQIKTCGFHLKEEGKELLGMLMAVLAK